MMNETTWLCFPSCSASSSSTLAGGSAIRGVVDAEGVAHLVADPAGDPVLQPRRGLQPLDERAPFEVGEHLVQLLGDLVELGEQVLLLRDGLVDVLLGGRFRRLRSRPSRSPARVVCGSVSLGVFGLLGLSSCSSFEASSGGCWDDSRSTICGTRVGGLLGPVRGRPGLAAAPGADLAGRRALVGGRVHGELRGGRRLLQEVGHRGHPVGGDVLEDLEHLGPLLQVADAELGVAHRLPDQVLARDDEARQATAVGPLGVGLVLDPLPVLVAVELLRRELAELLVRLEELPLAVAHLQRLPVPLAQLLGEPDRVLLGVEDVERVGRRVDPGAAREVVLGEDAKRDRLRLDPQRLARRRCRRARAIPCRARRPPAPARPWPGSLMVASSAPRHSRPTRLTPKSSWARTWNASCSESSTTFWRGRPSQESVGASSSRPLTSAGTAPCPRGRAGPASGTPPCAGRRPAPGRLATVAPEGGRLRPSTVAAESSRLAVATNLASLPLTSETEPPRTSLRTARGRPR